MSTNQQADLEIAPDYTLAQPYRLYTNVDHSVWGTLYRQQLHVLQGRVCDEFFDGLRALNMQADSVPNFAQLNERLEQATGWRIVAVNGHVPDDVFFMHLSERRFPVTWWLRSQKKIEYLQEPDCFHDCFGHVPLLVNPIFADYMQAYGQGGLRALKLNQLSNLVRLYWYTVEFGLLKTPAGLRIYGAGIISSKTESIYALESDVPQRIGFDIERILRTQYKIDDVQKTYFVIDSFEQLMTETQKDFAPLYETLGQLPSFAPDARLSNDNPHRQDSEIMRALEANEIAQSLSKLPDWQYSTAQKAIHKTYLFADFKQAFAFMQKVANYAETHNHHPEWFNVYNRLEVCLTTHDVQGLSERDLAMAQWMDGQIARYAHAGSKEALGSV